MTEDQRLRHESDANKKTVEKYGNLKVEGETNTETFGSRKESTTGAYVSIGGK